MFSFSRTMLPLVGFNKVPIIDKSVDFPLPLIPFKITQDEFFIYKFLFFKA